MIVKIERQVDNYNKLIGLIWNCIDILTYFDTNNRHFSIIILPSKKRNMCPLENNN